VVKPPRPRDPLFDAVCEVTGSDPALNGDHAGKVTAALRKASPPYTPAEVRRVPAAVRAAGLDIPTTLGVVEKYAGWVRHPPAKADDADAEAEGQGVPADPAGKIPVYEQSFPDGSGFAEEQEIFDARSWLVNACGWEHRAAKEWAGSLPDAVTRDELERRCREASGRKPEASPCN
jgi:hypothetical protein